MRFKITNINEWSSWAWLAVILIISLFFVFTAMAMGKISVMWFWINVFAIGFVAYFVIPPKK